jgi:phage terminase small subunit
LTPRQLRFAQEYVIDLNATQAAIRAGYAKGSAAVQGSRLLINAKIQIEIGRLEKLKADELGISHERVLIELARIAFANMADYMKVDGQGYPRLDFSALTREQAAALTEVSVAEYVEHGGEDEEGSRVKKVRFKLADKRAALVDLGKHIGIFREREQGGGASSDKRFIRTIIEAIIEKKANSIDI